MADKQVSFIGLGAMGFGMATHLVQKGYEVTGFDVWAPTLERFAAAGGKTATTPAAAAAGRPVCVCMVATAAQAQQVLVDNPHAAIPALPHGASIVLCSTVPCGYVQQLARQLADPVGPIRRPDLQLIDAPVSGGATRAAEGTLSIMAGAETAVLADAARNTPGRRVLAELADPARLYFVGGIGAGSNTKMVHQVLATIQILGGAEGMGLAIQLGLPASQETVAALMASPGRSWMLGHRSTRMLSNFQPVASAIQIAGKDVAIITGEARRANFLPLMTSIVDSCFVAALARGWKLDDDSALLRLYADTDGTRDNLPGSLPPAAAVHAAGAGSRDALQLTVGLLKGIHLAAAAEALAFTHLLGLDLDQVLGLCIDAAGGSAILEAHGPSIVAALRNGTAATGWPANGATDTLESIFQDLTAAVNAAQLRKASVYLGAQALNIVTLARHLLGGDPSKLAAGSIVKVWVAFGGSHSLHHL